LVQNPPPCEKSELSHKAGTWHTGHHPALVFVQTWALLRLFHLTRKKGAEGRKKKKKKGLHCPNISVSSTICHEGQLRVTSAHRISKTLLEEMAHVFISGWRERQADLKMCRSQ